MANLNSTLSTVALSPPEEAPATSNSRLQGKSADQVAQARKDRKAAAGSGKKPQEKKKAGSDDESSAEENENNKKGGMMKLSDLNAPREMSRREKEQADKIAAKERYAKLHAAGKVSSSFLYLSLSLSLIRDELFDLIADLFLLILVLTPSDRRS